MFLSPCSRVHLCSILLNIHSRSEITRSWKLVSLLLEAEFMLIITSNNSFHHTISISLFWLEAVQLNSRNLEAYLLKFSIFFLSSSECLIVHQLCSLLYTLAWISWTGSLSIFCTADIDWSTVVSATSN